MTTEAKPPSIPLYEGREVFLFFPAGLPVFIWPCAEHFYLALRRAFLSGPAPSIFFWPCAEQWSQRAELNRRPTDYESDLSNKPQYLKTTRNNQINSLIWFLVRWLFPYQNLQHRLPILFS